MAEAAEDQQITSAPVRRWVQRAAVLLGTLALLGTLVQAPGTRTAEAAPTGSRTVAVSIDELSPSAPKSGDTLTVSTWKDGEAVLFEAAVDDTVVLSGGRALFAS